MHADSLDSAVKRLTQKPMDIAPAYIPLMNVILSVKRVSLLRNEERKVFRRVVGVSEIVDYEDYLTTFKWDPEDDLHNSKGGGTRSCCRPFFYVGAERAPL